MVFQSKAQDEFNIKPVSCGETGQIVDLCGRIYAGTPDWLDDDDHIRTINFAKTLCSETATLTTLSIGINIDGSARAEWLQEQIDKSYYMLRHWVEYGCAYGTIILKPNGNGVDLCLPDDYIVTAQDGEQITGAVFVDSAVDNDLYYTRLEYHRFEGDVYRITNRCYVGKSENDPGKAIDIKDTPWSDLEEEVGITGIDKPLFGVMRTPGANNVDIGSAVGLPVFYNAVEELKDLDIAYSRMTKEVKDSKRTVLLDSDRLLPTGGRVAANNAAFRAMSEEMGLPDYVKSVYGDGQESFYQEINPTINTEARMVAINALLSQIGFKCGFSNGYFVFDEKTGMVTATQVEADDRRTIQTITDMRDKLKSCLDGLIYALNAFADLYGKAPAGAYDVNYDFNDITENVEEDRARWWQYVQTGNVPAWLYFVMFEGMSEDNARAMVAEAAPNNLTLFGGE